MYAYIIFVKKNNSGNMFKITCHGFPNANLKIIFDKIIFSDDVRYIHWFALNSDEIRRLIKSFISNRIIFYNYYKDGDFEEVDSTDFYSFPEDSLDNDTIKCSKLLNNIISTIIKS